MTLEEGLIFDLGNKGTIKVTTTNKSGDFLSEWYLQDKSNHVSADWFYNKLKNNEEGIYQFASVFDYETDSEEIKNKVEQYEKRLDEETDNCGFDAVVYMIEVFVQEATGEPEIHWW